MESSTPQLEPDPEHTPFGDADLDAPHAASPTSDDPPGEEENAGRKKRRAFSFGKQPKTPAHNEPEPHTLTAEPEPTVEDEPEPEPELTAEELFAHTDEPSEPVDHAPDAPVAKIEKLEVLYPGRSAAHAVDGVSFEIHPGETIGLVGESGSGKSTIARCLAGLQKPSGGRIELLGQQLGQGSGRKLRKLRASLGYIFQDPATSLNPRMTIGECIAEPLIVHQKLKGPALAERVRNLLDAVALPEGAEKRYPHELSGGQRQRVGFARALALEPKLVIADEPTSALDVSVQAKVLELFAQLQAEHGFACLFISHDLAVVDQLCDRIVVLRAGKVVESGSRDEVLRSPRAEYTRALIAAVPDPQPEWLHAWA